MHAAATAAAPSGALPLDCVLPQNAFSSRHRMDCGAEGCEATLRPSILLISVAFGAATEPGALGAALSSPENTTQGPSRAAHRGLAHPSAGYAMRLPGTACKRQMRLHPPAMNPAPSDCRDPRPPCHSADTTGCVWPLVLRPPWLA